MKHICSASIRRVPPQLLIEARGTAEHLHHIGHPRDVPGGKILVERSGLVEHSIHARDTGGVPV